MIERGHKPIVHTFSKMSAEESTNWVRNLLAVLWADLLTIHISTDLISYHIYDKNKLALSIGLEVLTKQILPWDKIYSTTDLLAMHAHQL